VERAGAGASRIGETGHRAPRTSPLVGRVWQLRDSISAYDGVYVALAEALDAPLLTATPSSPAPRAPCEDRTGTELIIPHGICSARNAVQLLRTTWASPVVLPPPHECIGRGVTPCHRKWRLPLSDDDNNVPTGCRRVRVPVAFAGKTISTSTSCSQTASPRSLRLTLT